MGNYTEGSKCLLPEAVGNDDHSTSGGFHIIADHGTERSLECATEHHYKHLSSVRVTGISLIRIAVKQIHCPSRQRTHSSAIGNHLVGQSG